MSASEPIDIAARALRHRDRSRRQVDERLASAGVTADERADALDTLERVGYVDDGRYAQARAGSLADRGYGDEAIRLLLAGDGIDPEVVDAAVGRLEPEPERARRVVAKLGQTPKVATQLQRKGFGADALEAAFGATFADGGGAA